LPFGRSDAERQAGLLWLLALAGGTAEADALVAQGLWVLGWADGRTGRPLARDQAFSAYRDTWVVFDRLGVLGNDWRSNRQPPAQAAIDLARTALLVPEPAPASPRATNPVAAFELDVTLLDVEPRIWRRVVVPESISLRDLHNVLQVALGWDNTHLYQFAIDDVDYGEVEDMDELGDVRTKLVDLVTPGATFRYDYDFGDGWEHEVRVLRTTAADGPHCLDGARACPPEDCGGPPGYERLLEVLAEPTHPEHDELAEWIGRSVDPEAFDRAAVDAALRSLPRRGRNR
jgi:Plasmid pRiA4b ORF-3-like protein